MAAGAQQNHVDSAPDSPPASAVSSRLVNHVSSAATTMPSSISRSSSLAGNGTDQPMQSNHFPGNYFIVVRSGMFCDRPGKSGKPPGAICDQNILNFLSKSGNFMFTVGVDNEHC